MVIAAAGAMVIASRVLAAGRQARIGFLGFTASYSADDLRTVAAFVQRLRELGWSEGANLVIERRYAEGRNERYAELAAELVGLGCELVVCGGGTAARALMAASRTLPIVTFAVPDPVRSGLVASLARPGGQLTGISNLSDELQPKRLELLKAALPVARRIAVARCPSCLLSAGATAAEVDALHAELEAAAGSLRVQLIALDVDAASDFDAAAATLRRERPDGLLIGATQINVALHERWIALAGALRLPMMAPYRGFGALLSYGPEYRAIFRKAAEYVAKILGGAKPGELAMAQPTIFELVVNLKIARALGIAIPQALLLRADEVIE